MHSGQIKSPMGTKARELSDACQGKDVSGGYSNDTDPLSSSQRCTCNGRHHLSSETSSLLGACSSHDSFFEIAESEACLVASATSEEKVVKNRGCDGDQIFSNQHGQQKESECSGDNISCISGSSTRNVVAYNHDGRPETKHESCSLASVNSFPGIENPVNGQPASCHKLKILSCKVDNDHTRTDKFTIESSQAIAVCSNKSELSEISSLRVSSSGTSSLKGEPSECPEERLESSLIGVTTLGVGGQIKNVHSYVEVKCPDNQKSFKKSIPKVEESNIGEPSLHSQLVDNSKESDAAELEVKVCDICGDAGREDLLVDCGRCSDGAEHIYCMRVKLDKIPEGDWMCEECMLTEESRNHMQDKLEKIVATVSNQSSLLRIKENLGSSSVCKYKNSLKWGVKSSCPEKISEFKSSPYFSSKRSAGCLEAVPMAKRMAFDSIKQLEFSRPLNKMYLNSSIENINKGKIKQIPDLNISGDHLSDHALEVGDKSHKLQREYQIAQGHLSMSKSFTITDAKGEVLRMEGGVLKWNCARKTAVVNNNKARGTARMMKSMSFSNAILDNRNSSGSQVVNCYSNFSHVEDLKRLKHAKERSSTDSERTSKFHNPLASSLVADAGVNTLMTDKRSAHGKITSPLSSGSIYHGLEDGQNHVKSNEELPGLLAIPFTVVPQRNYRWKGELEIWGGGRLRRTCDEIQAHLSTRTSPKVVEVIQKLPQKFLLEEVPRLNKWPAQFLENQATEDTIALFFFACDVKSYERGYKDLLECMIKNDLSLKGDIDEFELLIFPSNLFPEKTQRWDQLFLWGVLRGRKVDCSSELPILQKTICICSRSKHQSNKNRHLSDFPMSWSQHLCSCAHSDESLSAHSASNNVNQREKSFTLLEPLASGRMSEICESKLFPTENRLSNLQTDLVIQGSRVYHAKTEQARHALHMDFSEKEETDSMRTRMLHHSVKVDSECIMDSARVAQERENKRLKNCFSRMDDLHNFKDMNCFSETSSTGMNGLGSTLTSKNHMHSRAYDIPTSSTNFSSIDGRMGITSVQQQVILTDGSDHFDSTFPDLELSLGFRQKSAKPRAMPPFVADDSENRLSKHSDTSKSQKRDGIESSVPLSLSLALPFSKTEQATNPSSKTHLRLPECCGVNTTLSL